MIRLKLWWESKRDWKKRAKTVEMCFRMISDSLDREDREAKKSAEERAADFVEERRGTEWMAWVHDELYRMVVEKGWDDEVRKERFLEAVDLRFGSSSLDYPPIRLMS